MGERRVALAGGPADLAARAATARGRDRPLARGRRAELAPAGSRGAAVPARRELLRELAHDLRHAELVYASGVALVRQLLRDGGSPLYVADTEGALDTAIKQARAALLLD